MRGPFKTGNRHTECSLLFFLGSRRVCLGQVSESQPRKLNFAIRSYFEVYFATTSLWLPAVLQRRGQTRSPRKFQLPAVCPGRGGEACPKLPETTSSDVFAAAHSCYCRRDLRRLGKWYFATPSCRPDRCPRENPCRVAWSGQLGSTDSFFWKKKKSCRFWLCPCPPLVALWGRREFWNRGGSVSVLFFLCSFFFSFSHVVWRRRLHRHIVFFLPGRG